MAQTKDGAIKCSARKLGISVEEYLLKSVNEKRCTKCKEWQPKSNYNIDNSRWDNLKSNCHLCNRVKVKKDMKGRVSSFKGKHHTEESKELIRIKNLGNTNHLNHKHTLETKKIISTKLRLVVNRGEKCHFYKNGKTLEHRDIRYSMEYKRWKMDVFFRDKFTCQKCGDNRGGNLNAHHIKPFAEYIDLRMDLDNGITLCIDCHKLEHKK